MIRNKLGLRARSLMVAVAVVCWLSSGAAADALHGQNTVPSAPQNLEATALNPTAIFLLWDAPASDGGSPITGYRIDASTNRTDWIIPIGTTTGARDYTHRNREPGTTLYYRVSAINAEGTGNPSNVVPGITPGSTGGTGTAGAPSI